MAPVLKMLKSVLKLVLTGLVTRYCLISPTLRQGISKSKTWTIFASFQEMIPCAFSQKASQISPTEVILCPQAWLIPLPLPFHPSFVASLHHHRQTLWCIEPFILPLPLWFPDALTSLLCAFLAWIITAKTNKKYGTSSTLHILWDKRSTGRLRNGCLRQHCQERKRSPLQPNQPK